MRIFIEIIHDNDFIKAFFLSIFGAIGGYLGELLQNFQLLLGTFVQVCSIIAILTGTVLSYYKIKEIRRKLKE